MTFQQNSIKKQTGFTLLELIVVVAVLGLITSLATDFVINDTNQKRFEVTKQRLAEIKYGIIGNTSHAINGYPVISGFYADVNRLPLTISELIYQCRDLSNVGVAAENLSECNAVPGTWEVTWNGPYLRNIQSSGTDLVFQDGWANSSSDGNFGWLLSSVAGDQLIQSVGLEGDSSGTGAYEVDYPSATNYLVTSAETSHIDGLLGKIHCVNTSTKTFDPNFTTELTCEAEVDHIWVTSL